MLYNINGLGELMGGEGGAKVSRRRLRGMLLRLVESMTGGHDWLGLLFAPRRPHAAQRRLR